ncbi:hypothetical protein ACWCOV_20665 [Kribbella sp. NPDC002412]
MVGLAAPWWFEAFVELQVGFSLFAGFVVVVGWAIARVGGPWVDRAKARLAQEQAGAERYGWRPGADTDGLLASAGGRCFGQDGQVRRVLIGEYDGRRIRMCEFMYRTKSRYLPTDSVNNLVAVELPVRLPDLVVTRQWLAEPGMLSFDGESEAFNRQYSVASPDPRYSSAMLHPRMMELLLAHPDLSFRIVGSLVVAYSPTPWTVPQTLATLPALSRVVDLIPPFALADFAQPTH